MIWYGPTLLALAVAFLATRGLVVMLGRMGLYDVPVDRSSHTVPTPRGGGLGILAGIAAGGVGAAFLEHPLPGLGFWAGAALVALTGWLDDLRGGTSPALRLMLHFLAASLVLIGTGGLEAFPLPGPVSFSLGLLAWPAAMLWIVGVTNIYNFLDGIDGYAVAQGVIAGLVLFGLSGMAPSLALGGVIAGACVGFGVFNWHRARIFMGDVGSGTLGFLFAALPFHAGTATASGLVFVVALSLWFFLADGLYTLVRRALKCERVWEAHRSHLYQRLVITGLGHNQVVRRLAIFAVPVAVAGLLVGLTDKLSLMWGAFAVAVVGFGVFVVYVRMREQRTEVDGTERGRWAGEF